MADEQTFESELEAALAPEAEAEPADAVIDEEPLEEETPEPEPVAGTPDFVEIGGRRYLVSELAPAADFLEWARSDANRWTELQGYANGQRIMVAPGQQSQTPPPPQFPEYIDPDEIVTKLQREVAAMREMQEQRDRAESRWALDSATRTFRSNHQQLTDEDFDRIQATVAQRRLIQAHGTTGEYLTREEIARRSFEDAYKILFFDQHAKEGGRKVVSDLTRRRKTAASAASSASLARTEPVPTTRDEINNAMVREISQALSGE